jgi:UDP-glucose 4-epimerase
MSDPERDFEINARSQLRFLLLCREMCPGARIIYAGTRQVYGRCEYLPVDEEHPIRPIAFNGIHKHAAEQYHLLLSRRGEMNCVVLRLSNVYGPRMALHLTHQGVLSVFFRHALLRQPLNVYGGNQVRDPIYVDDAVDAFLRAGLRQLNSERVYNIGGMERLSLRQIAEVISDVADLACPVMRSFPSELRSIDIGDYVTDGEMAARHLEWVPRVGFTDGVRLTLKYYRQCGFDYISPTPALYSAGVAR